MGYEGQHFDYDELNRIAAALQEYSQQHPEERAQTEELADKVVNYHSAEAEA